MIKGCLVVASTSRSVNTLFTYREKASPNLSPILHACPAVFQTSPTMAFHGMIEEKHTHEESAQTIMKQGGKGHNKRNTGKT